jgi:hypothetical protein
LNIAVGRLNFACQRDLINDFLRAEIFGFAWDLVSSDPCPNVAFFRVFACPGF